MGKDYNLINTEELVKKAEGVKSEVITRNKKSLGKTVFKNTVIASLISIMMTSVAFGGTHTVDNWESYKNAIVEDLLKQETMIKVHYTGNESFPSTQAIGEKLQSLYLEAESRLDQFNQNNRYKVGFQGSQVATDGQGNFFLANGQKNLLYKNSYEELQQVRAIIDSVLSQIIEPDMTDYEKVKVVYDYVLEAFYYQKHATNPDDTTNIIKERNILSGLNGNGVVCDAYTMLLSKMLTSLGFDNIMVEGYVYGDGLHAWNLVNIDGQWYHIDSTWGDSPIAGSKERYFLTSDGVLSAEHSWDTSKYPSAPNVFDVDAELEKIQVREIRFMLNGVQLRLDDAETIDDIDEIRIQIAEIDNEIQLINNQSLKFELQNEYNSLLDLIDAKEFDILNPSGNGSGGEENPSDEEPGDNDPSDEEPGDNEPSDEEPGDNEPSDEEPGDNEPSDEEPGDNEPSDEEPGDNEPSDEEPGDNEPSDEEPGDNEPSDEEPGDNEPSDEEPGDNEPSDEEPGDNDPSDEEPGDNEPSDEEPGDNEPSDEEPGDNEPSDEEPGDNEPSEEEPVVQEPVVQEPVVQEPVVQEPVVQEPVVQEPVVQTPVVQEPVVQTPVVQQPSNNNGSSNNGGNSNSSGNSDIKSSNESNQKNQEALRQEALRQEALRQEALRQEALRRCLSSKLSYLIFSFVSELPLTWSL